MIVFIAGVGFGFLFASASAALVEDRSAFRWAGGFLLAIAAFLWITGKAIALIALGRA